MLLFFIELVMQSNVLVNSDGSIIIIHNNIIERKLIKTW